MASHTERTLNFLRRKGYDAGIVERFIHQARRRIDLFGFIDIIAIGDGKIWGVQSCGKGFAEHDNKIRNTPKIAAIAQRWLAKPSGALMLIGWRKIKKKRGGKAFSYEPRVKIYTLEDFGGDE